jgi:hypothetical protein
LGLIRHAVRLKNSTANGKQVNTTEDKLTPPSGNSKAEEDVDDTDFNTQFEDFLDKIGISNETDTFKIESEGFDWAGGPMDGLNSADMDSSFIQPGLDGCTASNFDWISGAMVGLQNDAKCPHPTSFESNDNASVASADSVWTSLA